MENLKDEVLKYDPQDIVILCGAGISYNNPTNLPTIEKIISSIIQYCSPNDLTKKSLRDRISSLTFSPRFEVIVNDIRKYHDPELKIGRLFDSKYFNLLHRIISEFILKGSSVITTNFDRCIENALGQNQYQLTIFDGKDLSEDIIAKSALIKPHGSNIINQNANTLVISIAALAKLNNAFSSLPNWRRYLLQTLKNKVLLVLGYSGNDDFDITPLILDSEIKKCFWLKHKRGKSPTRINTKADDTRLVREVKNLSLFEGDTYIFLEGLLDDPSKGIINDAFVDTFTIETYLAENYKTEISKIELLSTLLYYYELYTELLSICENVSDSEIILLNIIRALYRLGDHKMICEYLRDKDISNFSYPIAIKLLHHYSTAIFYEGEFSKGEELGAEMYALAAKNNDQESQAHAFIQLGAFAYNRGDYTKAKTFYHKSIELQDDNTSIETSSNAYWGLGDIYSIIVYPNLRTAVKQS